jgi:hypothetical protein
MESPPKKKKNWNIKRFNVYVEKEGYYIILQHRPWLNEKLCFLVEVRKKQRVEVFYKVNGSKNSTVKCWPKLCLRKKQLEV